MRSALSIAFATHSYLCSCVARRLSFLRTAIVALALCVIAPNRFLGQQAEGVEINGRSVTLNLLNPTNEHTQLWSARASDVSFVLTTNHGETIHEILLSRHIMPDVESFGVVYLLNPSISSLSRLDGASLRIPALKDDPQLDQYFSQGYLLAFTVDKPIKDHFSKVVSQLSASVSEIMALATRTQSPTSQQLEAFKTIQRISRLLDRMNQRLLRRYGPPVPTEVIQQLSREAELMGQMLTSQSALSDTEKNQVRLSAIKKDVDLKTAPFLETAAGKAPDRWPEVEVNVRTLLEGKSIPNLRIIYVPEALLNESESARSFEGLSSPSKRVLPEADYCLWAIHEPSITRISNQQCIEVRQSRGAMQVDLTLTAGK